MPARWMYPEMPLNVYHNQLLFGSTQFIRLFLREQRVGRAELYLQHHVVSQELCGRWGRP